MWNVKGRPVPLDWLSLEPVTVLYEFDGPRIFTCADDPGNRYLAYQCGEENRIMRFLVVPFGDDHLRRLTEGEDNLHDALTKPRAWVFDIGFDWSRKAAWEVQIEDIPRDSIPRPGVMLWPHLKPRIKATVPVVCSTRDELSYAEVGAVGAA